MNKRFRFAPSPSGIMHLGNMRAALINYIFAKESHNSFILRIENTDKERSTSPFIDKINELLSIFNLLPDEGPRQGGPYGPYVQSQRQAIYEKYFLLLQEKKYIYRCFKSKKELEEEKADQEKNKRPPQYVRHTLTAAQEKEYLQKKTPFVWRLAIQHKTTLTQNKDGNLCTYDLKHFSDFIIRRSDNSFTFLFTNCIDDIEMKISEVIRGCDHKTNTILQSYLYDILECKKPLFYHLPLITDRNGKKLSKRDNHFSVESLLSEGILPQAILNYLAIIGSSMSEEILSLEEMIQKNIFDNRKENTAITYDYQKLLWINTQWMKKISYSDFVSYLKKNYIVSERMNTEKYVNDLKEESQTIQEFIAYDHAMHSEEAPCFPQKKKEFIQSITAALIAICEKKNDSNECDGITLLLQNTTASKKEVFQTVRQIITGTKEGIRVQLLLEHIDKKVLVEKINRIIYS